MSVSKIDGERVLAIVPARGGSKGIPRKNLATLCGLPLIAYTLKAAQGARRVSRLVVTTDDREIAEVARQYGAEVPFVRPAEISGDEASTVSAVLHCLGELEARGDSTYDIIVLLQPTTPLRSSADIDNTIAALQGDSTAATAISLAEVGGNHPYYLYTPTNATETRFRIMLGPEVLGVRRQEFPPVFVRTGSVYAVRSNYLRAKQALMAPETLGILVPPERAVNIDSPSDLALAEYYLLRRNRTD